jgi:hypothetical protein
MEGGKVRGKNFFIDDEHFFYGFPESSKVRAVEEEMFH